MTVAQVVSALPSFGLKDLKTIKSVLDSLVVGEPEDPQDYIINALRVELGNVGVAGWSASDHVKRMWAKAHIVIETFLNKNFVGVSQSKRYALCRMLFATLIINLRDMNVPVTFNTVVQQSHRLPEMFENAFPGYLASGLSYMVIAAITGKD